MTWRTGALACALAACGGRGASPPIVVPPPTVAVAPSVDAVASAASVVRKRSAIVGDEAPVRVAVDVVAFRATREKRELADALDYLPQAQAFKRATGVDIFADGVWAVVYGSSLVTAGKSSWVVRYARAEGEVASLPRDPRAAGVGLVAVRPQVGVAALVPREQQAAAPAPDLTGPLDPGLSAGEVVHVRLDDPSRSVGGLPSELGTLDVVIRAADDGGVDLAADGACTDADACRRAAIELRDVATRSNTTMVRLALRGLLDRLTMEGAPGEEGVRAEAARLVAKLHARPEQIHAVANVLGASLGAPVPP